MLAVIIEDDQNKRKQLCRFLDEKYGEWQVEVAESYHSGLRRVLDNQVGLVLLDMTMPTFDISADEPGGELKGYGGWEILEELDRRGICVPVIVITQFDRFGDQANALTLQELDARLSRDYPDMYFGAVFYNSAREGWKADLERRIQGLLSKGGL